MLINDYMKFGNIVFAWENYFLKVISFLLLEDKHTNVSNSDSSSAVSKPLQGQNGHDKQSINHNQHQHHYPTSQSQIQTPVTATIPNSQSIDLLGLGFNSPSNNNNNNIINTNTKPTMPTKSNQEALLDIFGGPSPPPEVSATSPVHSMPTNNNNNLDSLFSNTFELPTSPTNQMPSFSFTPITGVIDNHKQFLFQNSDIIYDNSVLQINLKAEFKQNLGRLTLTFTNKTNFVFQNFMIQNSDLDENILRLIYKKGELQTIQPNSQLNQLINLECTNDFEYLPVLTVQFR